MIDFEHIKPNIRVEHVTFAGHVPAQQAGFLVLGEKPKPTPIVSPARLTGKYDSLGDDAMVEIHVVVNGKPENHWVRFSDLRMVN